jgi:hypothetical protein
MTNINKKRAIYYWFIFRMKSIRNKTNTKKLLERLPIVRNTFFLIKVEGRKDIDASKCKCTVLLRESNQTLTYY